MTDPSKKVSNPLFNAAVTGGTFEDFSQHALLLPAKEKPPPPVLNLSQDQLLGQASSTILEPSIEPQFETFTNQSEPVQNVFIQPEEEENSTKQSSVSNFSSVFSSFSGAFSKIKGTSNQLPQEEIPVAAPAGIENFISQNSVNVQPIPLFPTTSVNFETPKPPTNSGPVNSFRRSTGLKRPTYAQIPNLVQHANPPQITQNLPPVPSTNFPPTVQDYSQQPFYPPQVNQPSQFTPLQVISQQENFFNPAQNFPQPPLETGYYNPQILTQSSSTSPAGSTSSKQENNPSPSVAYQFKPIAPTPSVPSLIAQPLPTQKLPFSSSSFAGPVMADIPANEALQSSKMQSSNEAFTTSSSTSYQTYLPVLHHWFYKKEVEGKVLWKPFTVVDSLLLEEAFTSNDLDPDKVIATDGGRYDVNILRRERTPVYWKGTPSEVRRCSWFHKGNTEGRYVPYDENVATKLEAEYKIAFEQNSWQRKVELENGESVVFHSPDVLAVFTPTQQVDSWGNSTNQLRPKIVKRGVEDFEIDQGEPSKVDHLLFMVHGIGSVCDLKFRSVEEVVDEFRSIAFQLVQSHYRSSCEKGVSSRVEVLPISWHDQLHSEDTGIDKQLKSITLNSIPRLRDFTNDTLLDILFYTSPIYCQTIISTVGNELNRIYNLFKQRNPAFEGGVSLGGHSLGSLILFDLLGHQKLPEPEPEEEPEQLNGEDDVLAPLNKPHPLQRKMSRRISYMMGKIGTGQPQIHYPQLDFHPRAFFALGSPVGMFVTVRGLDTLGEQFALPTCPAFFNIFHPYDPVAYRIESLINPDLCTLKPVLIPHHKGRKRMHLELKETMARVGADLKQKVVDSMKNTWNSFYQLAMFHRQDQPPSLEEEVNKAFQEQLEVKENEEEEELPQETTDLSLGTLNKGRRIDYVLQEAPFEFFNEYLFALTSHVCYWESEDTILLMLKEIYTTLGVSTDSQIPQQTMTIERPPSSPRSLRVTPKQSQTIGMDPTMPIQQSTTLGPPPTSGFLRKT